MTLEEKIFERRRFIPELLLEYGFQNVNDIIVYETDFMSDDFHAIITVSEKGILSGKVIDKMNNEEYAQLRMENMTGAYVSQVRSEYEILLADIAGKCCSKVFFTFEQANRITEQIIKEYDVYPDFPWKQNQYQSYGTFRHKDSEKWFALIMNIKWNTLLKNKVEETIDVINLKINPNERDMFTKKNGIYPGYHMNHRNWISVVLNDTLEDEAVMQLIKNSFKST